MSKEISKETLHNKLISKQAAITIPFMPKQYREYQTFNLDDAYEQGWLDCQKCIGELPSAQPLTRCKFCEYSVCIKADNRFCSNFLEVQKDG